MSMVAWQRKKSPYEGSAEQNLKTCPDRGEKSLVGAQAFTLLKIIPSLVQILDHKIKDSIWIRFRGGKPK